jgi:hypothetical protein
MQKIKLLAAIACFLCHTISATSQNVGIGNNNPLEKLHIDSGQVKIGRAVLSPGQTHLLKFGNGDFVTLGEALADDQMVLSAGYFTFKSTGLGGRVGIGTSGFPAAQLEVNGNVKIIDGLQGAGKVLTSDAAGLAAWQTPAYANTGFKAVIAGPSQSISPGANVNIAFTGEEYDDANAFSLTAYTVPSTGLYHFDVMVNWDLSPVVGLTFHAAVITVNGADIHGSAIYIPSEEMGLHTQSFSCDIKLMSGQIVSVYVNQSSGILQHLRGNVGATRYTYFSGRRVY